MLERKLSKLIKTGRLTVKGLRREPVTVGAVVPDAPHLDVVVRIKDRCTAAWILLRPELHFAEAYMDRSLVLERGTLWDLLDLCGQNFAPHSWYRIPDPLRRTGRTLAFAVHQWNSRRRARKNVAFHYDLSDVFFRSFLDADRHYSCAYFRSPSDTLEHAQSAKVMHIAAKLLLRPNMHVLDIGCGWGGLAIALARLTGVQVTGITLSKEQAAFATRRIDKAGLRDQVTVAVMDYRDVQHQYDRIVSVGMFEHVGVPYYRAFFDTIARLLTENGVALLHAIGRSNGPGMTGAWTRKYIFPGAYAPALSEVLPWVEKAGLRVTDIELLRLHYADTLRHWRERFLANVEHVRSVYDERFCRMWEYFLAGTEMGFRYHNLIVFQMQLAKRIDAVPLVRDYVTVAESAMRTVNTLPVRTLR